MPQTLGSLRTDRKTAPHNESSSDPGVSDDSTAGYEIGSQWINTTSDTFWVCMDATAGAAVWKDQTAMLSTPVSIANGGTGQTTQTAAMDALSPTTTKGDLLVDDGTNVIRRAVGTDAQFLQADSSQASGVNWVTIPGVSDTIVTLGSDQESSSSALADVTGFGFTMAANTKYYIKYTIRTTVTGSSPATTEGHLYTVNGSAAANFISLIWTRYTSTPTAPSCSGITAYDGGAIISSTAFISEGIETIEGIISNGGSSSTLVLRFRTETNGSASVRTTIEAGSYLIYRIVT